MPRVESAPINFDSPRDREIQSECLEGAVYLTPQGIKEGLDVRKIGYQMGGDLQHRAQGSAGMVVTDGKKYDVRKDHGWVSVVFKQGENLPYVSNANIAIVHGRYPTSGGSNHRENIQPFYLDGIWFAHHGNLTNTDEIKQDLPPERRNALDKLIRRLKHEKDPDSDSWLALNAITRNPGNRGLDLGQKLLSAQSHFEGGWAFILSDGKSIVASRDPYGIRPLMLGYLGPEDNPWGYAVAVETSAFEKIKGYRSYRDIEPGETVQIDDKGEVVLDKSPKGKRLCGFEFVYLHAVQSRFEGKLIYESRRDAGKVLWREAPVGLEDDGEIVVVPVPDSGRPSAYGYVEEAQKSLGTRIKLEEAMIKNRYKGRNYIEPTSKRANAEDMYTILEDLVKGKIVVLLDDSIVKGITSRAIVGLFRKAGAKEVHLRIVSPPIVWASQYGVDQSGILFAKEYPNKADRESFLGVNSLGHLSLQGLSEAIGIPLDELCMRCMGGDGPPLPKSMIKLNEAA